MNRYDYQELLEDAFTRHYTEGSDVWSTDTSSEEATCIALAQALEHTTNKLHVLDIGCGNGRHLSLLEHHAQSYIGVDLFENKNWESARSSASIPAAFTAQDFLSFASQTEQQYDLIIDCGCFHHQHPDDHAPYLQQITSLLSDVGTVSMVVWGEPFTHGDIDQFGRFHFHFTPESITDLLLRNGLRVQEIFISQGKGGTRQLQVIAQKIPTTNA